MIKKKNTSTTVAQVYINIKINLLKDFYLFIVRKKYGFDEFFIDVTWRNLLPAINRLARMNLSIYSREEKRKRFQSASSWRESTGSTESMSERTGKEKG